MVEPLEQRLLCFVGGFNAVLDGGVLRVTGTNTLDNVSIRVSNPNQVQVSEANSGSEYFKESRIDRIVIRLRGARDILNWGPVDPNKPTTIEGGSGPDEINGSTNKDKIFGNGGSDRINGDDGNDTIRGGSGNDLMFEGQFTNESGNDEYFGGKGPKDAISYELHGAHELSIDNNRNDGFGDEKDNIHRDIEVLAGSRGSDTLQGSGGDETIIGSGGFDIISGLGGDDRLYGTFPDQSVDGDSDSFFGGPGTDKIFVDDANIDSVKGGSGKDTVDADGFDVVRDDVEVTR